MEESSGYSQGEGSAEIGDYNPDEYDDDFENDYDEME
jgi:hypothetical protein